MKAFSFRCSGAILLAAMASLATMRGVKAATSPILLPNSAPDIFGGEYAEEDAQQSGLNNPQQVTLENIDSPFLAGANNDVSVVIFAETSPVGGTPTTSFGQKIDLLRFYTQVPVGGY